MAFHKNCHLRNNLKAEKETSVGIYREKGHPWRRNSQFKGPELGLPWWSSS